VPGVGVLVHDWELVFQLATGQNATVELAKKFAPEMARAVPAGPLEGDRDVMIGGSTPYVHVGGTGEVRELYRLYDSTCM
jgi:hypothetical protein